ncbi:LysE/ArgO family amino acid transporter [Granulosicoccaceae sp. 1_MG-2023]|nr:LysE/ArgO family amino acid transporter [Granulosicoccaceae sp. 1_MG-2023]
MSTAFLQGAGLSGGLIMAIGAQNAFVLEKAIRNHHPLLIALICSSIDAILICAGVIGLGILIREVPYLIPLATWGGALFLIVYGVRALQRARSPGSLRAADSKAIAPARRTLVLATLAISLLNPHVYLDTVILLGSVGGQLPGRQPLAFIAGAALMSVCWFFTLALAGKRLAPFFAEEKHWRRLDMLVGLTLLTIALTLIVKALAA